MIRQRIRLTGRVQAVGLRYRARQTARRLGITGFVRNEYDGSVILEVQGSSDQIGMMMAELYAGPFISIEETEWEPKPVKEEEKDFRVHYI